MVLSHIKVNFKIHYHKPELVNLSVLGKQYKESKDENEESQYNPFEIQQLQLYQPIYKLFFEGRQGTFDYSVSG